MKCPKCKRKADKVNGAWHCHCCIHSWGHSDVVQKILDKYIADRTALQKRQADPIELARNDGAIKALQEAVTAVEISEEN